MKVPKLSGRVFQVIRDQSGVEGYGHILVGDLVCGVDESEVTPAMRKRYRKHLFTTIPGEPPDVGDGKRWAYVFLPAEVREVLPVCAGFIYGDGI